MRPLRLRSVLSVMGLGSSFACGPTAAVPAGAEGGTTDDQRRVVCEGPLIDHDGDLEIDGNTRIEDVVCLRSVNGTLTVRGTIWTDMRKLAELRSVGRGLSIRENPEILSLEGLERLETVKVDRYSGGLLLSGNAKLRTLVGLAGLRDLGNGLSISESASLEDLSGMSPELEALDDGLYVSISTCAVLENLNGLREMTRLKFRSVSVKDTERLSDLTALNGRFAPEAELILQELPALTGAGLPRLDGVEEMVTLALEDLPRVESLEAFSTLEEARRVRFRGLPELRDLKGLRSLRSIYELDIGEVCETGPEGRMPTGLETLDGLEGLKQAGALVFAGLPRLRDVNALRVAVDGGLKVGGIWLVANSSLEPATVEFLNGVPEQEPFLACENRGQPADKACLDHACPRYQPDGP